MFKSISLTGSGMAVLVIGVVARSLELDLDEGNITELAQAFALVIGFLGAVGGQVRRKDLSWGLFRK